MYIYFSKAHTSLGHIIDKFELEAVIQRYDLDFDLNFDLAWVSLLEALSNSIEHGSEYGKKGPVYLNFKKGSKKLLAIIKDPGKGFDIYNVPKTKNDKRGHGVKYLALSDEFLFGIDKTNNDFNTLLLYNKRSW